MVKRRLYVKMDTIKLGAMKRVTVSLFMETVESEDTKILKLGKLRWNYRN